MRRSRSSSNIPLPKFRRNLSSENLASAGTSQSGLRKSVSSSNLLSVPRLSELNKGPDDLLASSSKHIRGRFTGTPLRPVGAINVRRFTATPVSQNKGQCSPSVLLTTNRINDKKFSSEQYKKIYAFLKERMEDFDPKLLRPLTLSFFVQIMSLLFEEIDPRINVTMANYKEVVFKYLKLFKYPGPVSMSLLKSVNTNLSWNQVMSIFGWLVDVVNDLKSPDPEIDLLDRYILGRANKLIRLGCATKGLHIDYIEELLNLDSTGVEIFEKECEQLKHEVENKNTLINEQKEEEKKLNEKLEQMKLEIKEFKEDNLEAKLKDEIRKLKTEHEVRGSKIEEIKLSTSELQQAISNQKYSLKDKQQLQQKIEDKNYSIKLKKEELENIYELKNDYDYQQTDYRRQIETKIHGINGKLLHLQLCNFLDDTQNIRLPDRGFHSSTFLQELEEKLQLLEDINKKVDSEYERVQQVFLEKQREAHELSEDVDDIKKNTCALKNEIEKINDEKNRVLFEFDIIKKQDENRMAQLIEAAPDVDSIKKKNMELQEEVLILKEKMNVMSEQSMNLCKKIYEDTQKRAFQMKTMMKDLKEKAIAAYEQKVQREKEVCTLLEKCETDFVTQANFCPPQNPKADLRKDGI